MGFNASDFLRKRRQERLVARIIKLTDGYPPAVRATAQLMGTFNGTPEERLDQSITWLRDRGVEPGEQSWRAEWVNIFGSLIIRFGESVYDPSGRQERE